MLENLERPNFTNDSGRLISEALLSVFQKRKTTRDFSPEEVDEEIVLNAIRIGGTAPSGANKQPWSFCLVKDQATKEIIRSKAEEQEHHFYEKAAPQKWLDDLKPLHTNSTKKFITDASYLIAVFSKLHGTDANEKKTNHYYVKESVGLATGFLISALHLSGLNVLTYTPSNRNFMVELLQRPHNERTFMVLAVGRASSKAQSPVISKKALSEILTVYEGITPRLPESDS